MCPILYPLPLFTLKINILILLSFSESARIPASWGVHPPVWCICLLSFPVSSFLMEFCNFFVELIFSIDLVWFCCLFKPMGIPWAQVSECVPRKLFTFAFTGNPDSYLSFWAQDSYISSQMFTWILLPCCIQVAASISHENLFFFFFCYPEAQVEGKLSCCFSWSIRSFECICFIVGISWSPTTYRLKATSPVPVQARKALDPKTCDKYFWGYYRIIIIKPNSHFKYIGTPFLWNSCTYF